MKYSELKVICPFCNKPTERELIAELFAYNPLVDTAYNATSIGFCMCEDCKKKLIEKLEKGEI